jgi:hypothetical protein
MKRAKFEYQMVDGSILQNPDNGSISLYKLNNLVTIP